MSGIVGIVNLNGAPIDADVLNRLTASLEYRGPDGQGTWTGGRVGFGHTMLRTTIESRRERQPCSLDGQTWIVADARIDGRPALHRRLCAAGLDVPKTATDPELILHAYRVWDVDCVRHLIGDFAFAIWDAGQRRLFCARDHFGVKPFFYARVGGCLVFSNTLDCVREYPGISDDLCEHAIADFLLLGINQDESTTAFDGVQRLPPAHRLIEAGSTPRVDRYWSLPIGRRLRYRRSGDYAEHFSEHLAEAVSDRLRDHRIGVLMSGGLDSTSVAAVAREQLSGQNHRFDLRAYTCVYDRMFADEERRFSGVAAASLGIPVHYLVADDYALFERWREIALPEPADEPLAAIYIDQARQMAGASRVALTGWDGDALLGERPRRFGGSLYRGIRGLRRRAAGVWRRLSPGRIKYLEATRNNHCKIRKYREKLMVLPEWAAPDLVERLDLRARWAALAACAPPVGLEHGNAHRCLTSPLLGNLLEKYDPGVTRAPIEARHPLLDVRLVEFVLSLPASPWCVDKKLLREAMIGRLPEAVRSRPKSVLAGDPVIELLRREDSGWVDRFEATRILGKFVDRTEVPQVTSPGDPDRAWTDLRPLCLNMWLENLAGAGRGPGSEEYHEVA
jgi:asparagine synthase (glutamine-hydrolysing)